MAKVAGYLHRSTWTSAIASVPGNCWRPSNCRRWQTISTRAAAGIDEVTADVGRRAGEIDARAIRTMTSRTCRTRACSTCRSARRAWSRNRISTRRTRATWWRRPRWRAAMSKVAAGENHIRMAQAEEARFKTLEKYTRITAPFDGVVTKRYANVGSMIQAGTASQTQAMPIVRLSDNRMLRLIVPVPESSVGGIVRWAAGHGPRALAQADDRRPRRTFFRPAADVDANDGHGDRRGESRSDADAGNVRRGGSGVASPRRTRWWFPLDASTGRTATARAYLSRRQSHFVSSPIKTGLETATQVEVLGGLHEGDAVVVGRRSGLTDGEQVRARPVTRDANHAATKATDRVTLRHQNAVSRRCRLPDRRTPRRGQRRPAAGGHVPVDEHSGRRRRDVLRGNATRADRRRHHVSPGTVLHAGQRHRPYRVAIAERRQHDQGLLSIRHRSGHRRRDHLDSGDFGHERSAARHVCRRSC